MKLANTKLLTISLLPAVMADTRSLQATVPEGSVCTSAFTDPLRDSLGQYYEPVTFPCPAADTIVAYSFVFRHSQNSEENTGTQASMAASHQGSDPVSGLTIWRSDFCGGEEMEVKEKPWIGEVENPLCSGALNDPNKVCYGISMIALNAGDEQEMVVGIHNDGRCEGNVTLEVAIVDNNEVVSAPGSCVQEVEECSSSASKALFIGAVSVSMMLLTNAM